MAGSFSLYQRFVAAGSGSNQILQACLNAGSSSQDAYETAYPATIRANFTYSEQTTLSNVTPTASVFNPDFYNAGSASKAINRNDANFVYQYTTPILIPADKTLGSVVDARIAVNVDTSHLGDGTLSPIVNTVQASTFGTNQTNGLILVSGDDAYIKDSNLANGFNVVGQQQQYRGFFQFGVNGPVIGHNGNNSTLPAPGDGQYAVTGSLIVSSSKLMFYNGAASNNGWTAII